MKKRNVKNIAGIVCSLALVLGNGINPLNASATTVQDVIAHAYAVGLPEATIQQCINTYSSGTYTSEQCDKAIAMLNEWAAERDEAIAGGETPAVTTPASAVTNPVVTTKPSTNTEKPVTSKPSTNTEKPVTSKPDANTEKPVTSTENKVTGETTTSAESNNMAGSISKDKFNNMTIEQKQEYIAGLSAEQKTQLIQNMTPEEKNNFIKELDVTVQADIIANFVGFGEAFGLNLSVDKISDDAISISARDENGNLIDVTTFGNTVEATGIPYTAPILIGGSAILFSVAGIIWVLKKSC